MNALPTSRKTTLVLEVGGGHILLIYRSIPVYKDAKPVLVFRTKFKREKERPISIDHVFYWLGELIADKAYLEALIEKIHKFEEVEET